MGYEKNTSTGRSGAWYLLPILFGIVGSVITYVAINKDDPGKAKNCWIIGGVLTVVALVSLAIPGY